MKYLLTVIIVVLSRNTTLKEMPLRTILMVRVVLALPRLARHLALPRGSPMQDMRGWRSVSESLLGNGVLNRSHIHNIALLVTRLHRLQNHKNRCRSLTNQDTVAMLGLETRPVDIGVCVATPRPDHGLAHRLLKCRIEDRVRRSSNLNHRRVNRLNSP